MTAVDESAAMEVHNRIIEIEVRLLRARRCWGGADRIAERAPEINATKHKAALGSIQSVLTDMAVIQTCALFEESTRNKSHSIPGLLRTLRSKQPNDERHLRDLFRDHISESEKLPAAFFEYAERYKAPPLSDALASVRAARDKRLAHFDREPEAIVVKYAHVDDLISHCKIVLRMASTYFGGRIASPDEELVSHLSLHKRGDMKRLIAALID